MSEQLNIPNATDVEALNELITGLEAGRDAGLGTEDTQAVIDDLLDQFTGLVTGQISIDDINK